MLFARVLIQLEDQNYAIISQSEWIIEPVADGFYRLINRSNGRVLGVDSCNANIGSVVQSYDWLDIDCQKWKFEPLADGYYRITPKHAQNRCLSIQLCSSIDGIKVQQWSWLNTDSQYWKLNWIAPAI